MAFFWRGNEGRPKRIYLAWLSPLEDLGKMSPFSACIFFFKRVAGKSHQKNSCVFFFFCQFFCSDSKISGQNTWMNNPPLSPYKSTWMVYGHLIVNIQRLVVELGIVGQLLHGPCGGFATTTRFGSGDLGSLK